MIPAAKPLSPEEKRQLVVMDFSRDHEDFRQAYEVIGDGPGRNYAVDALIEYCISRTIEKYKRLVEKYQKSRRYRTSEYRKIIVPFYQKINRLMKNKHHPKQIEGAIKRSTGIDGKMKADPQIKQADRERVLSFVHSESVLNAYYILSNELYSSEFGRRISRYDLHALQSAVKLGIEEPFNNEGELVRCAFERALLWRCNPLANDLIERLSTDRPEKVARLFMDRLINRAGLGRYPGKPSKRTSHI